MNDLAKLKRHVKKYQNEYALIGLGVAVGVSGMVLFRSKPKVNEDLIIAKWMEHLVLDHDLNIYALTHEQKALWEAAWSWIVSEADRVSMPLSEVLAALTREFVDSRVMVEVV